MRRIIERINKRIPMSVRKNKAASGILMFLYRILIFFDADFKNQMRLAMDSYRDSVCTKRALYADMISEYVRFFVRPMEYAKFGFFNKTQEERRAYLSDFEVISIFKWTAGNNILPDSKYERYKIFKQFFKREVLCIDSFHPSEEEYRSFLSGKDCVVVKPLKGTKGRGIAIVPTSDIQSLRDFKKRYPNDCLLEDAIDQGDEMRRIHPSSVNTVRFVTGMDHFGLYHPLFALVRVGRGGSVVDNVSSGGLVALIDMEKGQICTQACCGTARYAFHPDTNVEFFGFKIPAWDMLCKLVRDIHLSQKGQRVFGLDLAWNGNEWDLVEVNPAPSFDSFQELTGKGARSYLRGLNMIR